jgi:hypothetical protein
MAVLHSRLELARGNPAASSEALARVQLERRPLVDLTRASQSTLPELKTLGDTAVSKQVTGKTAAVRGPARMRLALAGAVVALLVGLYALNPLGTKPAPTGTTHTPAAIAPTPIAPTPIAPAPTPAVPLPIEIGLDSVPTGASVFVDDVLVGTTPTTFKTAKTGDPVEFTFRTPGFEAEKIRALPAQGLAISAKFSTPVAAKPPSPAKHKRAATSAGGPSTDIQTER